MYIKFEDDNGNLTVLNVNSLFGYRSSKNGLEIRFFKTADPQDFWAKSFKSVNETKFAMDRIENALSKVQSSGSLHINFIQI